MALAVCAIAVLAAVLPGTSRAQPAPPLRVAVLPATGWIEVSSDPPTWRCTACDPTVVLMVSQRADAWPDMPETVRAMEGSAFTRGVLADADQRQRLVEGIVREVRSGGPGLTVDAVLAGARTIGNLDFVEARITVRYGSGLTAATAFLTFHKGWLVQVATIYGVADLPAAVTQELERFLGGVSFAE